MLHFKIKHVLRERGIFNPDVWLREVIQLTADDADNLLNNKQGSIEVAAIERICNTLGCTFNELVYWDYSETSLPPHHPINFALTPPDIHCDWQRIIQKMDAPTEEAFYRLMIQKLK